MDNKAFTFLVTSNRKGKTLSYSISSAWLKTGLALGVVSFVLLAAAAVDYTGLLLESGENKRLRAKNAQLVRQFQVVEGKLGSLETSMERLKSLTTKIKLITNIKDDDRSLNLAMGGKEKPGQHFHGFDTPMDERGPASEFLQHRDSLFLPSTPLNKKVGELATEKRQNFASLSIRIDQSVKTSQLMEQGVLKLQGILAERQSLLNATPSIKPARGWFSSRFGYRIHPIYGRPVMHNGLDIAAPPGTPVYAPADGVVSYVGYESGYGKLVAIDHGYGVKTRFGHNSQLFVELGQKVSRYDVIAAVGSTGRSTSPHLHYEVRVHGVPVDPMNYVLNE